TLPPFPFSRPPRTFSLRHFGPFGLRPFSRPFLVLELLLGSRLVLGLWLDSCFPFSPQTIFRCLSDPGISNHACRHSANRHKGPAAGFVARVSFLFQALEPDRSFAHRYLSRTPPALQQHTDMNRHHRIGQTVREYNRKGAVPGRPSEVRSGLAVSVTRSAWRVGTQQRRRHVATPLTRSQNRATPPFAPFSVRQR